MTDIPHRVSGAVRARIHAVTQFARGKETHVDGDPEHTPTWRVRMPSAMWRAYGRVTARLGTNRSADLVQHVRDRIREHGDEHDLADLQHADDELMLRRARKGGRPRKHPE